MTVPLRQGYSKPPPLRAIGALLISPNSVARRLLDVCRDAFMDIRAAYVASREADAEHDRHLILLIDAIERRDGLAARRHALLAQEWDGKEDSLLTPCGVISKRLAGAIDRALVRRKGGARP